MSSSKGQNGDYAFTRAAYDEQRDSEVGFGVDWQTVLETTFQKGVWQVDTRVVPLYGPSAGRIVVRMSSAWPNSQVQSWSAFHYQHNHKVARMVENWHADQEAERSTRH